MLPSPLRTTRKPFGLCRSSLSQGPSRNPVGAAHDLHDTGLELTSGTRRRPHQQASCRHLLLPPKPVAQTVSCGDTRGKSARFREGYVGSSRERPGHPDRVRLRCPKSFAPWDDSGRTSWWGTSGRTLGYVLVVRPVITGTSAASCHNLPGTKAIRRAHFRLGHRAPGRGGRQARTVSGCVNSAFLNISQHFTSHLFRPWIPSSMLCQYSLSSLGAFLAA